MPVERELRVVFVVGVRPHFVKLGALLRALGLPEFAGFRPRVLWLSQHYDSAMTTDLLDDADGRYVLALERLEDPTQGRSRLNAMYAMTKKWLVAGDVDWLVVLGDAECSLAAALAGSALGVRVCHIEAGMRVPIRVGPEALIARAIDCISDLCLAASPATFDNLIAEECGRTKLVGDLYLDLLMERLSGPEPKSPRSVVVALHHLENELDYRDLLQTIDERLSRLGLRGVYVVHPRFRHGEAHLNVSAESEIFGAVLHGSLLDMVSDSAFVITDSGGLQREAYYLGRRCLLVQNSSWWPELADLGGQFCVGSELQQLDTGLSWVGEGSPLVQDLESFGGGKAAIGILRAIADETPLLGPE